MFALVDGGNEVTREHRRTRRLGQTLETLVQFARPVLQRAQVVHEVLQ